MQEQHFDELKSDLVKKLADMVPKRSREVAAEEIAKRIQDEVRDGRLMTLSPDEVNLLTDYRIWKTQENINGIFHWRKR